MMKYDNLGLSPLSWVQDPTLEWEPYVGFIKGYEGNFTLMMVHFCRLACLVFTRWAGLRYEPIGPIVHAWTSGPLP